MQMISSNVETTTSIDWKTLKGDYRVWRHTLYDKTKCELETMAIEKVSMASLNALGVYHKIAEGSQIMKTEYERSCKVPHKWIYKGNFPGIWCALFAPCNTYSFAAGISPDIIKLMFKADYYIFNPELREHQEMWLAWSSLGANINQANAWKSDLNFRSSSMADRISKICASPNHVAFFEEHAFGAIVGYSDYMALVVVQEEAIESVDFLNPIIEVPAAFTSADIDLFACNASASTFRSTAIAQAMPSSRRAPFEAFRLNESLSEEVNIAENPRIEGVAECNFSECTLL
jgi:hypothetical protein